MQMTKEGRIRPSVLTKGSYLRNVLLADHTVSLSFHLRVIKIKMFIWILFSLSCSQVLLYTTLLLRMYCSPLAMSLHIFMVCSALMVSVNYLKISLGLNTENTVRMREVLNTVLSSFPFAISQTNVTWGDAPLLYALSSSPQSQLCFETEPSRKDSSEQDLTASVSHTKWDQELLQSSVCLLSFST